MRFTAAMDSPPSSVDGIVAVVSTSHADAAFRVGVPLRESRRETDEAGYGDCDESSHVSSSLQSFDHFKLFEHLLVTVGFVERKRVF